MHTLLRISIFTFCFSTLSHAEKLGKETLVNRIFDRFQEIDEYVPVSKHKFTQAYDLENLKKMKISKLKELDSKASRWSGPECQVNGLTSLVCAYEIAHALAIEEILAFTENKTARQLEAQCPRVVELYGWTIDALKPIKERTETLNVNNEFMDQDKLRSLKDDFSGESLRSFLVVFEELKKKCGVALPKNDVKAGYIESVKEATKYVVSGILSIYVLRQFIAYWYKEEIADFHRRVKGIREQREARERKEQRRKNKKGNNGKNPGPELPQEPKVQSPKFFGVSNHGCMTAEVHAQSVPDVDAQAKRRQQEEQRAAQMARKEAEQQRQADIARERRAENARKKAQEITQADIARKKDEDRLNKKRDERLRQAEIENAANRELEKYVRLINDALTELEKNGDSEGLASLGAIIASIAEIDSDVLSDEAKKALKAIWNRLDQIGCDSDYQTELFKHRDNLEQYLFKIKII